MYHHRYSGISYQDLQNHWLHKYPSDRRYRSPTMWQKVHDPLQQYQPLDLHRQRNLHHYAIKSQVSQPHPYHKLLDLFV